MSKIIAYTDGSAVLKYPFKGGVGLYIQTPDKNYKIRKGYCNTKTGRMELTAVLTCLKAIKNKKSILTIYSDSMYAVNTCNEWIDGWENRCWIEVKNVDILKQLIVELRNFKRRPVLKHIKGHQEINKNTPKTKIKYIEGNCIADELANYKTQNSFELDLPLTDERVVELNLTKIELNDFKKINGKIYFIQEDWGCNQPEIKLKPEILTHPNIPKPLHGLNPRTLLGKEWWDKTRFKAQQKTDFKCSCCGVDKEKAKKYQWLEGHEYFDINYQTGVCEVKSIEPLCHYCHNFIHSGRLSMIIGEEKTKEEVVEILEHGFKILADNNLKCFPPTFGLAESLDAKTFGVKPYQLNLNCNLKWSDYVLKIENKIYTSNFKNENEWLKFYTKQNE